MANSTPIDPRRLGQRTAGGFTPIDLKAGAANVRGTARPKTQPPKGNSRGERNNNPGNLEDGAFARSQPGYVGSDGRFAKFDSIQAGERAQETLLRKNYANMSVAQIIQKYAPLGDNSEESVRNYIGYVASRTGVDPDAKLGEGHYNQVAAAMRAFETGKRGKIRFKPYAGQLTRAGSGGRAVGNSANGKVNVPSSQIQGPSGALNTGIANQSGRIMQSGPVIEGQQRTVEGRAIQAGQVLDDLMAKMTETQNTQIEAKKTQVNTVRAINSEMSNATNQMINRVKPVFERQQAIAAQALEIQNMSPIARAVRGFFDLNYNQDFLMNQMQRNNAIIEQVGQTYRQMQNYHADAINQTETLYQLDTAIPTLELAQLGEQAKAAEMNLQRAQSDLEITMQGVQNEVGLITAQRAARNDLLSQMDQPTAMNLLAQAEQSGDGTINFNGVTLSAQDLRERGQQIEDYNIAKENALMALGQNRAELMDYNANRMVSYATDAQIEQAIANGGVMDGVQIAPGVLTAEKTRRVQAVIQDAEIREFESTPMQAAQNAFRMSQYARSTALKADSIFGTAIIADEQIAFSNQIRDISNKIREATQRGASPVEIGVLNQQLMKAKAGFDKVVQEKVTRLVGNDEQGAAYVTSYLMGDRPTPGAAADMMVHFAARGGLPSAMESSQFGYNAMTEVMNTIESLRNTRNPATGRPRTDSQVLAEAARLLADPRSAEGQKFRQATRGLQFQATFQRLPLYARDAAGNPTHPLGAIDAEAFAVATRNADAMGLREIAGANGIEVDQLTSLLAGETPNGLSAERLKELDPAALGQQVSSAQQRALVSLVDQIDRASPEMKNSQALLDFLESPLAARAFAAVEGQSDRGGFADWMAGAIGRGGLGQNFGGYTKGFRGAVAISQEGDMKQALRIAQGYRNDVSRRTGALLIASGLQRGEATTLARAIGPLIPQGTPQEKEAQRVAAMTDQGSSALGNQLTYRSDLARRQIAAVDQIILSHKFDDPNVERIRKKVASNWEQVSSMADNLIDGLIGN